MEEISGKMAVGEQQGQVIQQELLQQEAIKKQLEEQAAASAAAALTPTITPTPVGLRPTTGTSPTPRR
jgi:hypothetical protein